MSPEKWRNNILHVVAQIASREYQQRSWFGIGTESSSPEELYCLLFDDFMYDEFLNSPAVGLTPTQKARGVELKEELDAYSELVGDYMDPAKVIDDPRWEGIRAAAQTFLNSF